MAIKSKVYICFQGDAKADNIVKKFNDTRIKPEFKSMAAEKRAKWINDMTPEELDIVVFTACFLSDDAE